MLKKIFRIYFTDKLILAISFPQLIELLIRSKYITENINLTLDEFQHKFVLSTENPRSISQALSRLFNILF